MVIGKQPTTDFTSANVTHFTNLFYNISLTTTFKVAVQAVSSDNLLSR